MTDTESHLWAVVKTTGDEIEAAVAGNLYEIDDERVIIHDTEVWKREKWDGARLAFRAEHPEFVEISDEDLDDRFGDEIGPKTLGKGVFCIDDIDDPEPVSVHDILSDDSLGDLRFEVNQRGEMLGAKTLVAWGGPNVWVSDDEVHGYWGGDERVYNFNDETRNELYEIFNEYWECARRNF